MTHCLTLSQFPQTFLTNPSKLRIYPCKIPTVITESLIVYTWLKQGYMVICKLYIFPTRHFIFLSVGLSKQQMVNRHFDMKRDKMNSIYLAPIT